MNRLLLFLLFTLNGFSLTLKEAVKSGLENNKNLLFLKKDVEEAKIKLKISSSLIYPTLNFKKSLQWMDKEKLPYSSSIALSLSQYIFKKGMLDEIRGAKYELTKAELSYQASEIETISEIAKKYIRLLELIEEEKVEMERINYLENLFLIANERFNMGLILELDVKGAFLSLKSARIKHETIKNHIELAKEELSLLTGIPQASIKPEDSLVFKPIDIEKDEEIRALENRIEIKKQKASLDKTRLSPSIIKARLFPIISLNGNYEWSAIEEGFFKSIENIKKERSDWSLSIVCEIPIFDGGRLNNEIKSARLSIKQGEILQERIKDEVIMDVKNARALLEDSLKTLEIKKEDLSLKEEGLRIANEMFKEGRKSLRDVLDEEERKNRAYIDYISSILDYENKKIDYYKALGSLKNFFSISDGAF